MLKMPGKIVKSTVVLYCPVDNMFWRFPQVIHRIIHRRPKVIHKKKKVIHR